MPCLAIGSLLTRLPPTSFSFEFPSEEEEEEKKGEKHVESDM